MEHFNPPQLPAMLNGAVMCVDAKAWNQFITYVNKQTEFINTLVDILNGVETKANTNADNIKILATNLKELLER